MPRIATALGVWIAVVCAIGFNIARYPVVWEMTAESARGEAVPPAAAAATTAPTASSTAPTTLPKRDSTTLPTGRVASSDTAATDRAAASEAAGKPREDKYRVECDGNSCKLVPVDKPASPAATAATAPSKPSESAPMEAAPAGKYASVQPATGSLSLTRVERPLVPLAQRGVSQATPKSMALAGGISSLDSKIRHLPPLSQEWTPPVVESDTSPNRPIPLYATTGK